MALLLSDRDLAALYYAWHNRLLCLRHLRRKFWKGRAPQAAARRVAQLSRAGYLRRIALPTLQERVLFGPTRLGNRALAEIEFIPPSCVSDLPDIPRELSPNTRHDLLVVDLRIAFEESGADAISWRSDHELRLLRPMRSVNTRTPDGVFEFDMGEGRKKGVLELELASYHRPKLAAALRRLRADYADSVIHFICRSPQRAATFRRCCLEMKTWNDRPAQLRFSHLAAATELGLRAPYADLREA
jgi:hypothetical protein